MIEGGKKKFENEGNPWKNRQDTFEKKPTFEQVDQASSKNQLMDV